MIFSTIYFFYSNSYIRFFRTLAKSIIHSFKKIFNKKFQFLHYVFLDSAIIDLLIMSTLFGVLDKKIKEECHWTTNKIGGGPVSPLRYD